MTEESAILRAYALATQGKVEDAKALLTGIESPVAKDLLARILYDTGEDEAARALWEDILDQEPGQPEARAALAADTVAHVGIAEPHVSTSRRRWLLGAIATALVAIGLGLGPWLGHHFTPTPPPRHESRPTFPLEFCLPASPTRADFEALRTNFLAQVDGNVKVVLSGGSGKNAHERRNRLWVLANALTEGYRCLTWEQIRIDFTPDPEDGYRFRLLSNQAP